MATLAKMTTLCIGLWWLLLVTLQQQPCECRYLPTRSHGDDLDKLRELMLQILESSSEQQQAPQVSTSSSSSSLQQQRPPNEANGNTLAQRRASWLDKLSALDTLEAPRKFSSARGGGGGGAFENGRMNNY